MGVTGSNNLGVLIGDKASVCLCGEILGVLGGDALGVLGGDDVGVLGGEDAGDGEDLVGDFFFGDFGLEFFLFLKVVGLS